MKVAGARKGPAIPRHALVGGDKHARTAATPVPWDIRHRNAKSNDCRRQLAIYALPAQWKFTYNFISHQAC
ncbi:hypothetical protein GCM10007919_58540 [Rhizobium indigoferae]|nr:hypothetical protein GCM10007919_58540 [Rhizobium indigoferae]